MPTPAYITVLGEASDDELAAMAGELRSAGLEVKELEAEPERFTGVEETVFAIVVVTSMKGFFDELGKDAYRGLKAHLSRLRATARGAENATVVLQDQLSNARADLTAGLDDPAYAALVELDFDALEPGVLTWDTAAQRWIQDG